MRANLHSRQAKGLSPCSGTQADGQQHSGALATTVCRVGKEEVTLSEPLGPSRQSATAYLVLRLCEGLSRLLPLVRGVQSFVVNMPFALRRM